jgi:hypothetical protein
MISTIVDHGRGKVGRRLGRRAIGDYFRPVQLTIDSKPG